MEFPMRLTPFVLGRNAWSRRSGTICGARSCSPSPRLQSCSTDLPPEEGGGYPRGVWRLLYA
eukprot:10401404-Prorocentrum_lima.AAC.1